MQSGICQTVFSFVLFIYGSVECHWKLLLWKLTNFGLEKTNVNLAKGRLNLPMALRIGNHMISSAIWDKSARVNFSKANQIPRARRASAICSL